MNKLAIIFEKHATGKNVLIYFVLTNIFYVVMLVVTIPKLMAFGKGMTLLDMMPMGYDYNYAYQLFTSLGETGREVYLYYQIPIDMIYPLLFGLSYSLILAYFLKKLNKLNTKTIYFCLLPIIVGIADYGENIGIITMLIKYPNLSEQMTSTTNAFTIIKSLVTSLYFAILIIVLVSLGIKKIRSYQ